MRTGQEKSSMEICKDDLTGKDIICFIEEHIIEMRSVTPLESKHALDISGLKKPDVTFWSARQGGRILGCGALKDLGGNCGEIKSMRTAASHRGQGVASALLAHIIAHAKQQGMEHLFLETGAIEFFAPARLLYEKFGFRFCAPFIGYKEDPNSVFMSLEL